MLTAIPIPSGRHRVGTVPIELALMLPMLLLTGLLLLYVSRISITTLVDAAGARREGWSRRSTAAQPGPLRVDTDPLLSTVMETVGRTHPRWSGLAPALPVDLNSSSSTRVVAGTWGASTVVGWSQVPEYWGTHTSISLQARAVTQVALDAIGATNTARLNPAIVGGILAVQKNLNGVQIVLGSATGGSSVSGASNLLGTLSLVVNSLYLATIGLERSP